MELHQYSLHTKAFFFNCIEHTERQLESKQFFQRLLHIKKVKLSRKSNNEDIFRELSVQDYFGFASLFFIIDFKCDCSLDQLLARLYKTLRNNIRLRYITKIVLAESYVRWKYTRKNLIVTCMDGKKCLFFKIPNKRRICKALQTAANKPSYTSRENPSISSLSSLLSLSLGVLRRDYIDRDEMRSTILEQLHCNAFQVPYVDNLIVIQCRKLVMLNTNVSLFGSYPAFLFFDDLLKNLKNKSVQESAINAVDKSNIAAKLVTSGVCNFATTSAGGCYVLNINPALGIIINHMNFGNLEIREESINDIRRLQKMFTKKKIPYLVIKDGSAQDVHEMMTEVKKYQFYGIEYLYVIIMSHGSEDNIIFTKTDSYNIYDDIITPLMCNRTLENVEKFILVNACRGDVDPFFESDDIVLQSTDASSLDDRIAILFSAHEGCVSYRETDGAIVVQKFCQSFEDYFIEKSSKAIADETEKAVCEWIPFDSNTEYCAKPGTEHQLKMSFKNITEYEQFLNDFKKLTLKNKK